VTGDDIGRVDDAMHIMSGLLNRAGSLSGPPNR
jgi:hypothetical protein